MRHGEVGLTYDADGVILDADDEMAAMADGCDWQTLIASRPDRFVDDLTGLPLVPDLCRAARQQEIDYFKAKGFGSSGQLMRLYGAWAADPSAFAGSRPAKGTTTTPMCAAG